MFGLCCDYVDRQIIMFGCFVFTALALFLCGPSGVFGLPQTFSCMFIGLCLLGFFSAGVFVPAIPEMTEAIQDDINRRMGYLQELN